MPYYSYSYITPLLMAVAPSDIESESGDSATSAGFSDHSAVDTDTDVEAVTGIHSGSKTGGPSLKPTAPMEEPRVYIDHCMLKTEFVGVRHRASAQTAEVHQFRGIKYGVVPMRFRKPVMHETFSAKTDATKNGCALYNIFI